MQDAQEPKALLKKTAILMDALSVQPKGIFWHFFPPADIYRWMHEPADIELLRQYAEENSEEAFAALVNRHVNMVYSAALRKTGNTHTAEEITQAVFTILAKKAANLSRHTALTGWLYQTVRLTTLNYLRGEIRRAHREQEAVMQSFQETSPEVLWPQIAPLLEDAMGKLGEKERNAVALRFFEDKSFSEIASAVGATENAAKKRVAHALEKLQRFFLKRGVKSTTESLSQTISTHSIQPAPALLAKTVTAVALAKGGTASISTLTLIKGALKLMAWTKTKTAIAVSAVAIAALVATTPIVVKLLFFPAIKDAYFQPNYRHFQNLPAGLFVLRPTHFKTPTNGLDYSAEGSSPSGEHVTRMMGRNRSFAQVIARLNNCALFQIVLPDGTPTEHFDYLFTILDNRVKERFDAVIQKKLGYVASWQERPTDVYLLTIQTPNSPGLKPSNPDTKIAFRHNAPDRFEFQRQPVSNLGYQIQDLANVPVTDATGLADNYDFVFDCSPEDLANHDLDQVNQSLSQLGLVLVRTNMPLRMLVVEKAD